MTCFQKLVFINSKIAKGVPLFLRYYFKSNFIGKVRTRASCQYFCINISSKEFFRHLLQNLKIGPYQFF